MANSCNRCGRLVCTAWRMAKGNYYHPHCFTCAICDTSLKSAEETEGSALKEIYCRQCYQKYFSQSDYIDSDDATNVKLESSTKVSQKTNFKEYESLASNTNFNSSMQVTKENFEEKKGNETQVSSSSEKNENEGGYLQNFFPSKIPRPNSSGKLVPQPNVPPKSPDYVSIVNIANFKPSQVRPSGFNTKSLPIMRKMSDYINSKGISFMNKPTSPTVNGRYALDGRDKKPPISNKTSNSRTTLVTSTKSGTPINTKASTLKIKSNFKMPTFSVPNLTPPPYPITEKEFQKKGSSPNMQQQYIKLSPVNKNTHKKYMLPKEIINNGINNSKGQIGAKPPVNRGNKCSNNAINRSSSCPPKKQPLTTSTSAYFGKFMSNLLLSSTDCKEKVERVEKKEEKGGLVEKGASSGTGSLDCTICLESLVDFSCGNNNTENVATGCGHIFHKSCLQNWLSKNGNSRCPICSHLCFAESIIPVYVEANIADNIKTADKEELVTLLSTIQSDYKLLKEKYLSLSQEHEECAARSVIMDSLKSAYEMECRTRGQLQWENKRLHQRLKEMENLIGIAQGDNLNILNNHSACH